MPKIVLASQNPVKLQATLKGFEAVYKGQHFDIQSVSIPSGVSEQPMSSEETLLGATNRANAARDKQNDADYWVGIEGGLEEQAGELVSFSWVVVLSAEHIGRARTGAYFLPPPLAALVRSGQELGESVDIVFGESNSKQKSGAVGLLTGGVIDRTRLYEQAVVLALIPFVKPELFAKETQTE